MSPADELQAVRAALYGPSSATLAKALPDIGEGLSAQLVNLSRDPTPVRCELLAMNLEGARRSVLQLREVLKREERGHGQ